MTDETLDPTPEVSEIPETVSTQEVAQEVEVETVPESTEKVNE